MMYSICFRRAIQFFEIFLILNEEASTCTCMFSIHMYVRVAMVHKMCIPSGRVIAPAHVGRHFITNDMEWRMGRREAM